MLIHINIKDFAIVENLDLELSSGMTVLTGETGAGKSLIIDALELALGNRADSELVRVGCERAQLTMTFDLSKLPTVQHWLEEQALDAVGECIIHRIITREGRSRCYINGTPCSVQTLRILGEQLIHIHGQHEHFALLKREAQCELLDHFAGHVSLVSEIKKLYQQWLEVQSEVNELKQLTQDRSQRVEFLRYQLSEIESLGTHHDEVKELHAEYKKLSSADKILGDCQKAFALISEDEQSVSRALYEALRILGSLVSYDKHLESAHELFNNALIQVNEGASELKHYLEHLELNPERLQWVEQRLNAIHDLARKHRIQAEELPELQTRLEEELKALENCDERLSILEAEQAKALQEYQKYAKKLSQQRKSAASKLAVSITEQMRKLGMPQGELDIQLQPYHANQFSENGLETVEFMVSANPGHPLQPLSKVVSGGELSRISLAIQVITAQSHATPTLMFDEVDVGIGGGIAQVVGGLMRKLGETHQVLCITHLPQVAAQAHHHYRLEKRQEEKSTKSQVVLLDDKERVHEIARMLGGVKITEQTLAHAKEMLSYSQA